MLIIAAVKKTGIRTRVMRISSGGSSHVTVSNVQFEKNCLCIPVMNLSAKVFGQKQAALLAVNSVHMDKLW